MTRYTEDDPVIQQVFEGDNEPKHLIFDSELISKADYNKTFDQLYKMGYGKAVGKMRNNKK